MDDHCDILAQAAVLDAGGPPPAEHLVQYADALARLRLLPEAVAAAQRADDDLRARGERLPAAEAQLRVARLLLLSGDAAGAGRAGRAAAAGFRRQRRTPWVARALLVTHQAQAALAPLTTAQLRSLRSCALVLEELGRCSDAVDAHLAAGGAAAARGQVRAALASYGRAERLARRAPVPVRLKGRVAAARSAQLQGDAATVLRHCRAGLRDLAAYRSALPSMELRAQASGRGAELGALGLAALLPTGSGPRVLDWLERTRAAVLVTVDHAGDAAPSGARDEPGAARASRAGRSVGTRAGAPVPVAELRRLLAGDVLVEYAALDGQLFAAVVEPRRTRLVELGPAQEAARSCDALLSALRRLARPVSTAGTAGTAGARAAADLHLRRLRAALVAPLGLRPDVPLVVVPVGALQRLPWAPLHDGPTTVAPSASLWARTRDLRGTGADSVALLAGPDLPGAVAGVEALRRLHRSATVLTPPDITPGAVAAALSGVGLAHVACRGSRRADNPAFSSLHLLDGALTVHELAVRGVAPHRIVLAACDCGVQVGGEGDEQLGFVSVLLARGTAGMVASTVPVPDVHALPLLQALHEQLLGGATLAEALHRARLRAPPQETREFAGWCAYNAYGAG